MADWHPCGKISITLIKLNPEWKALEKAAFIQGSILRKYIYFRLCRIPAAFIDLRLLIDLNRAKEYKSAQCQYPIRNQFPEISKEECVQNRWSLQNTSAKPLGLNDRRAVSRYILINCFLEHFFPLRKARP